MLYLGPTMFLWRGGGGGGGGYILDWMFFATKHHTFLFASFSL